MGKGCKLNLLYATTPPVTGTAEEIYLAETPEDYALVIAGLEPLGRLGKYGVKARRVARKGCSFSGDTLVYTAQGLKPISLLKTDMLVWSSVEQSEKTTFSAVEMVIKTKNKIEVLDLGSF
ncbi:hypothetical protein [Polycladidibacter stylochi]|uniref:hypothetical protein n=1 Tax=Polycladidibacter stylochi TaxID=1807766 RepID=UPI0008297F89|nr:hypothetical protein [Pseudovibrio stylochi]